MPKMKQQTPNLIGKGQYTGPIKGPYNHHIVNTAQQLVSVAIKEQHMLHKKLMVLRLKDEWK